jgi:signal transduction histidine kinase
MGKKTGSKNPQSRLTSAPRYQNFDQQRASQLAFRLTTTGLGISFFSSLVPLVSGASGRPFLVGIGVVAAIHVFSLLLLYSRQLRFASFFLPTMLLAASAIADMLVSNQSLSSFGGYIAATIIASQLLGDNGGRTFFIFSMLSSITAYLIEIFFGGPMFSLGRTQASTWFTDIAFFLWIGQLLFIASQHLMSVLVKIRTDQRSLERRLVQLQVAAEVARVAAALHETDLLLSRAVNIIEARFGFDIAGIYLLDETRQYAILRAVTGALGRQEQEHTQTIKVGEAGMVGYVTATGHHRVMGDFWKDPTFEKNPELSSIRSELTLPLKAGQMIIGALDVQSSQPDAFDKEDVTVLQTMADQLAVAIENARLFEATSRQLDELIALHGISLAASSASGEDEVIEQTTRIIGETLFPDNVGVLILTKRILREPIAYEGSADSKDYPPPYVLEFHPSYISQQPIDKSPIPLGQGIIGTVAKTGRTIRVNDVRLENKFRMIAEHIRSELCVPIKIDNRVIGVINSESSVVDDFDAQDERLMETIAGQLATAIQRIRAFEAERRRAAELESLRQASLQHSSTLDLRRVLAAILENALKLTGAFTSSIFLYDEGRLNFGMAIWADGIKRQGYDKPKSGDLTSRVAESGQMIAVPDLRRSKFSEGSESQGAILGLPLINQGRVLGVMNLSWIASPHEFDENELRVLRLLADQAAIALANAYLYTEAQERAAELAQSLAQREELVRLKNEFIQNVSHELRTPLAIARGYTDLLDKEEFGSLNDAQRDAVNILSRRINMLIKLVDDLVTILEAEALEIKLEEVNLAELVERVIKDFGPVAANKQLRLITNIQWDNEAKPPMVRGTSSHLNRLLDNLVGNAIKFTPAGGTITIVLHREGSLVALEVSDEGIGIPAEKIERIFERFYQVDGSTKRRFGGTGLGLALVKEIAEAHNGHVSVQSEVGKGSTFTVILPLIRP